MRAAVQDWTARFGDLHREWTGLPSPRPEPLPSTWPAQMVACREERDELVRRGQWRSGPRTLLAALGQHHLELALTAGLGWLLRPDGHHALGDAPLRAVLEHLGLRDQPSGRVRVQAEESREDTRADLVVTGQGWQVVVEAKTYADEQPTQCDRLHALWQVAGAQRFVFLTRTGASPRTAVESRAAWTLLTWQRLAALLRAVPDAERSPGAAEYLATLEAYHRVR